MALIAVKCPDCGANVELPEGKTRGFCVYCGAQIVLEEQRNIVNNVQNIHADSVSINNDQSGAARLEAAEAYMKLKKYKEAEMEFDRVIELTPQNPEGWWGKIRVVTQELTALLLLKSEIATAKGLWSSFWVIDQGKNKVRKKQFEDYIEKCEAYQENQNIEQRLKEAVSELKALFSQIQQNKTDLQKWEKKAAKKKWNVLKIVLNTMLGTLFGFVSLFGLPASLFLVGIPCVINLLILADRHNKRKEAAKCVGKLQETLAEEESRREALNREIKDMNERQVVLREILNNT